MHGQKDSITQKNTGGCRAVRWDAEESGGRAARGRSAGSSAVDDSVMAGSGADRQAGRAAIGRAAIGRPHDTSASCLPPPVRLPTAAASLAPSLSLAPASLLSPLPTCSIHQLLLLPERPSWPPSSPPLVTWPPSCVARRYRRGRCKAMHGAGRRNRSTRPGVLRRQRAPVLLRTAALQLQFHLHQLPTSGCAGGSHPAFHGCPLLVLLVVPPLLLVVPPLLPLTACLTWTSCREHPAARPARRRPGGMARAALGGAAEPARLAARQRAAHPQLVTSHRDASMCKQKRCPPRSHLKHEGGAAGDQAARAAVACRHQAAVSSYATRAHCVGVKPNTPRVAPPFSAPPHAPAAARGGNMAASCWRVPGWVGQAGRCCRGGLALLRRRPVAAAHKGLTVAEVRRDGELALFAHAHALDAQVPACGRGRAEALALSVGWEVWQAGCCGMPSMHGGCAI